MRVRMNGVNRVMIIEGSSEHPRLLFVAVATVNSDCTVLQRARHWSVQIFLSFLMGQAIFFLSNDHNIYPNE